MTRCVCLCRGGWGGGEEECEHVHSQKITVLSLLFVSKLFLLSSSRAPAPLAERTDAVRVKVGCHSDGYYRFLNTPPAVRMSAVCAMRCDVPLGWF